MKKIFTLLTAALMAVTASAQGNIWKASTNLTAEQTLVDNDDLTVTAPYAATVTASTQTIGGQEFTGYFNMRTGSKPSATNKYGAQSSGRTSLVVEAKKKVKFSLYDSHNNSAAFSAKAISHEDFDQVIEPSIDDSSVNLFAYNVESFEFEPGTYTVYYAGAGLNVYGFSWAVEGASSTGKSIILSNPEKAKKNILSGSDLGKDVPEGWSMQCMTSGKNLEAATKNFTIDGTEYVPIKFSNGAQNTVTLPEGLVATKVTFYATINKDAATERPCFWAEVAGKTYTADDNNGIIESYNNFSEPNVQSFDIPNLNQFTFKNSGEQPLAVLMIEYTEGGEEPETPAEPGEGEVTFTVEGSGSGTYGSTYGTYVGAFDYDAKNRELTLKNFLGSNTNVVLKYTLANEGSDPDAIDTNFNSEAVSGLGTDGSIENFADGSFIAQENGKDFMKLTNLKVTTGFYSPMSVTSEGSGTTAKKMLSFTIFVSGDSHRYNEETKEWYAAKYVFADKAWVAGEGVNSVSLKVSIPFDNGTSGIDNVVVDAEDENAPVEYYNLQGVRIAEPAAGQIVIRRQGSKVEKLLVR